MDKGSGGSRIYQTGKSIPNGGEENLLGGHFFPENCTRMGGNIGPSRRQWWVSGAGAGTGGRGLSPLRHPKSTNERSEGPLLKQKYF